ncbi:MAG: monofunctional biosynthetic peptidoglycan transglycosylase, partial [Gammaproteobacteria bacterium]|nr:monofunctional biosynthetic peptidoglycan transglycosylase [Gammaproteobacteria bacterium]
MRPPRGARQRGRSAAPLLRYLALALLFWVVLTATPVLLLRWLPPLSSAFMVEARVAAWREHRRDYHTDFRWVSLEQISPHAAVAVI